MENDLLDIIEDIKEFLTSDKYKTALDMLMKSKNEKKELYRLNIVSCYPSLNSVDEINERDDLVVETGIIMSIETKPLKIEEVEMIRVDLASKGRSILSQNKTGNEICGIPIFYTRFIVDIQKIQN